MNRLSMRLLTVAAVSLATVGVVAGISAAASSSPAKFYGCQDASGNITHISTNSSLTCSGGESVVSWNALGPIGPRGYRGYKGNQGNQGNPGLTGATGPKGATGATGPKGATGATGSMGAAGATGPAGTPGATGPEGPIGDTGASGPAGTPGATGPQGPVGDTGASGVNNPLVFGPYTTTGDLDSGQCGPNWATDAFTRTYIVTPQSDGTYQVTELFNGTFKTIAGVPQPGDSPGCASSQNGGVTGTMYGEYVLAQPAASSVGPSGTPGVGSFSPYATCTTSCSTTDFFSTFFNGAPFPATYSWEFFYKTPNNGMWANTKYGNSGDITG